MTSRIEPGGSFGAAGSAGGALPPPIRSGGLAWLAGMLAAALCAAAWGARGQEAAPLSLFTNVQQVLALGIEGAHRAPHPVRLRGVVTYPVIRRPWFYVQDSTGGILVVCANGSPQPSAGDLVEVVGHAGPGLPGPHVLDADYTVLGSAPLPAPRHADPARLALGEDFGQWVSLRGNVLDFFLYPGQVSFLLREGDQHFVANISLSEAIAPPNGWVGGRIEVHGVCWTEAQPSGVPSAFRVHCPSLDTVRRLRPGPTNLFDWPLETAGSLRARAGRRDERVRVAGVATLLVWNQSLFLRDDTGCIQARLLKPITERPYLQSVNADTLFMTLPAGGLAATYGRPRPYVELLEPGDRVEVIGTPAFSELGVVLVDAEYRRLGPGTPPSPVAVSGSDLLAGKYENDLVRFQGRLIDRQTHSISYGVEDVLTLRDGSTALQVLFSSEPSRALPVLPRGALLQVVGVCTTEIGEWKAVRTVRLLPRSRADVAVLAQPPPWDSWRVGRILLIGGALGLGALAWIEFLRARVARRTAELALSNSRLHAEVEERKRAQTELSRALAAEKELSQLKSRFVSLVSHEFRTPLGVILASADLLSDYLDTLTPEERAEQIADIKQSTRHMATLMEDVLALGRVESGRMGYRPRDFDLVEFCRRLIDELRSATAGRCPIEFVARDCQAMVRGDETLLRHIFNNLLANGVKYSAPGQPVRIEVKREGDDAVFTVVDQGIGVPADDQHHVFEAFFRGRNAGDRPGSGLGLVVVKRCVEIHGGSIHLESVEGRGTSVWVRVPLFRSAGQTEFLGRAAAPTLPSVYE